MNKISIITVTFNSEQYIRETIKSVINQNYKNTEYIIIDGGSTDRTLEIIDEYKEFIHTLISEPDDGMYFALNKGFQLCSGDICGWINSDDILMPQAFHSINKAFLNNKACQWLTGVPSNLISDGSIISSESHSFQDYSLKNYLLSKPYSIQQESTFFRRNLFIEVGGLNTEYTLAADYELWLKFLKKSPLFLTNFYVGAFRSHDLQLSSNKVKYLEEVEIIRSKSETAFSCVTKISHGVHSTLRKLFIKLYRRLFNGNTILKYNKKNGSIDERTNWL